MANGEAVATQPEATRQQVIDIVPELPFEDDPSTFARVMLELALIHAPDDESHAPDDQA